VLLSPGKELRVPVSELKASAAVADNSAAEAVMGSFAPRVVDWDAGGSGAAAHPESAAADGVADCGPRGAAMLLGMKRTTLQARMRKLGIRRPVDNREKQRFNTEALRSEHRGHGEKPRESEKRRV